MARIRVRRRAQAEEEQMLDITPLIDIVFIMLIFFIVTASFVKESGLEVEQPQAETASQKTQTSILVGISANGDIWINHQPVDLRAVRAQILRLHAETPREASSSRPTRTLGMKPWFRSWTRSGRLAYGTSPSRHARMIHDCRDPATHTCPSCPCVRGLGRLFLHLLVPDPIRYKCQFGCFRTGSVRFHPAP